MTSLVTFSIFSNTIFSNFKVGNLKGKFNEAGLVYRPVNLGFLFSRNT
jgi:hypothetical protein